MMPQPCGRLDWHDPHNWTRPRLGSDVPARTYHCTGRILIEGGWWLDWDATDDANEARLDREIRDGLSGGWTGDAA